MGIEIHLHGPLLARNRAPATEESVARGEADADESDASASDGGRSGAALGGLLALAVLVGLAFAVRRLRGDGAEIEIDE
jgi:hypothetical protein